ncbi:MAG: 50S ribosomal protein L10 [Deltaproteobacteria bacterium]|nr:50S ribosomal protein L10 [Deltaproteobacteria bacterium]
MDKEEKEQFVADMNSRLKKAKATFLVDYQGLDVETMNRLRSELRKIGAEFQVVKNRLLKLASRDTETESIKDQFVGPCGLAITYDDIVAPAKVLVDLNKDLKELKIKIGQMSGKPMELDAIKRLAALPGRDQLIAQVLAAMQAVPTSLARALNGVILNLLNVLKAIESNKGNEQQVPENN